MSDKAVRDISPLGLKIINMVFFKFGISVIIYSREHIRYISFPKIQEKEIIFSWICGYFYALCGEDILVLEKE